MPGATKRCLEAGARHLRRRGLRRNAMSESERTNAQLSSGQQEQAFMQVKVPPHPLMKHWMAVLRSAETPPPVFKATMVELGRLLLVEATRDWLSTLEVDANTPTGSSATVELIDTSEPVRIVPILRAGLALAESAPSVLPVTAMHHLGFKRDVTSLEPVPYLDALPTTISETSPVIIMDPIVATGGTSIAAIERVKQAGASEHNIRLLCANASARAMQTLSQKYKKLQVFSGSIDEEVNDQGMVLPGMGDAGDRAFNSPI